MRKSKLDGWKTKLEEIFSSFERGETDSVITEIRNLGAAMGSEMADTLLAAYPHFLAYRPRLKQVYHDIIVKNEIAQVNNYLRVDAKGSAVFDELASTLTRRFYDRSSDMFEHVDFSKCGCFVLVGSGWVPLNLFAVRARTDVEELVGLDILADAIETSRKLVRHLEFDRIKAIHEDGRHYDYSKADIVYVVGMVSTAKAGILSRIADTAPENVQVIVNDPYSLGRLWEESAEESLDPRLEIFARSPDWYAGRLAAGENVPAAALSRDLYIRRRKAGSVL